jgi:hypothetical protein
MKSKAKGGCGHPPYETERFYADVVDEDRGRRRRWWID